MKKAKRILALLLSALFLLGIASCGSGSISSGQTSFGPGGSNSGLDTPKGDDIDVTPEDGVTSGEATSEPDATTSGDVTTEDDLTTSGDVTTEDDVSTNGDVTTEADVTTGDNVVPEPSPARGSEVGDICYSLDLSLIGGGVVNIEELRGKVIILNFWGAWCPPCRNELVNEFPSIPEAYGNDVIILTIHSVYSYDADYVDALLIESGLKNNSSFLFAIDSGDESYYTELGGGNTWPYTLILGRDGVILKKFAYAITFENDLRPLLNTAVGSGSSGGSETPAPSVTTESSSSSESDPPPEEPEVPASEGLKFLLRNDEFYSVAGIGTCTDTVLVIPSTYNGLPVRRIEKGAFQYYDSLKSVVIPNSVTEIGESSFMCCESLTNVTIPESVTYIHEGAFAGCVNLQSFTVRPDNSTYKSVDGNLYYKNGKKLLHYAPGKSNTSFTIPNDVTEIGDYAFCSSKNLTTILIPTGVVTIGEGAFSACTELTSISIPEGVSEIQNKAFHSCTKLGSISLPDSATTLGHYVFYGCTSLTSITVPAGITRTGEGMFYNCTSLTSFTFKGTITDWNDLHKDFFWNQYAPFTVVHCSDGDVTVN